MEDQKLLNLKFKPSLKCVKNSLYFDRNRVTATKHYLKGISVLTGCLEKYRFTHKCEKN